MGVKVGVGAAWQPAREKSRRRGKRDFMREYPVENLHSGLHLVGIKTTLWQIKNKHPGIVISFEGTDT
jgi:hypothetical protein